MSKYAWHENRLAVWYWTPGAEVVEEYGTAFEPTLLLHVDLEKLRWGRQVIAHECQSCGQPMFGNRCLGCGDSRAVEGDVRIKTQMSLVERMPFAARLLSLEEGITVALLYTECGRVDVYRPENTLGVLWNCTIEHGEMTTRNGDIPVRLIVEGDYEDRSMQHPDFTGSR